MSLDEDNHGSTQSTKMRVRRSMDIEFHDHLYDDMFDEIQEWDRQNNQEQKGRKQEGNVDDDSFGEATDTCQPDHEFLEQILEEYHPERINLLDPTVPESVYMKKTRSSESSVVSSSKATEQQDGEKPPPTADTSSISTRSSGANYTNNDDTRTKLNSKKADDSESDTEEDGDDAFRKSPQQRGNDRTTLFGTMGEETKRSLRTINGTFWSKPFKGLTPSVRGDGGATGVADS